MGEKYVFGNVRYNMLWSDRFILCVCAGVEGTHSILMHVMGLYCQRPNNHVVAIAQCTCIETGKYISHATPQVV